MSTALCALVLSLCRFPRPIKPLPRFGVLFLSLSLLTINAYAQSAFPQSNGLDIFNSKLRPYRIDDTTWVCAGICKTQFRWIVKNETRAYESERVEASLVKRSLLKITGNVQYDFLYRSFVDLPYAQHDFQQHTIRTSLNIIVDDRYPLKLNLAARLSNSPFFKNFFDAGLVFDRHTYSRNLKQKLLEKISAYHLQRPDIKSLETLLKNDIEKYSSLRQQLNDPDILQRLIEEREAAYYKSLSPDKQTSEIPIVDIDQLKKIQALPTAASNGSTEKNEYSHLISKYKQEADSLQLKIETQQRKLDSLKIAASKNIASVRQKIYKLTNPAELKKLAAENGIVEEKKKGIESFLANIKSIGIGRSMVNYSELTAYNVSLTGFNMEYNPGLYTAIAVGKIDYGFRDFGGRNSRRKDQNFLMGRIGMGDKDNKAIIFSAFTGRKNSYGSIAPDSVSGHINIVGYSMEAILKKNENTELIAEIAKTTAAVSGSLRNNGQSKSLLNFSDNSNLGISIKAQTVVNLTNTRLSGFYKKTGENFQSFSLFSYNTDQTAWLLKADQSFLQNKIGVIAMLRKNDFVNPFTEKTFKTTTVFKSMQVNVRFPKWPAVSAGYFPGTQLYIVNKERIRESAYYILNGSVVHSYTAAGTRMISSLIYNKYSSKATDSGFISYRGVSYTASHSLNLKKAQLEGIYTYTDQEQMKFSTLESNADYSLASFFRVGGGIKYNKVMNGKAYWGSRAQIGIEVKQIGVLQLQYEKSYLPTIYQTLYPIELGRVSWSKYF